MIGIDVSNLLLLAQEATNKVAPKAAEEVPAGPLSSMLPALAAIMVLFYVLILRPQRAKDKKFSTMVDNLKETDRVVTIGGIHGVVTNVQRGADGGIVTIRVDESTGAKIRVGSSAIARVLVDEEKPA